MPRSSTHVAGFEVDLALQQQAEGNRLGPQLALDLEAQGVVTHVLLFHDDSHLQRALQDAGLEVEDRAAQQARISSTLTPATAFPVRSGLPKFSTDRGASGSARAVCPTAGGRRGAASRWTDPERLEIRRVQEPAQVALDGLPELRKGERAALTRLVLLVGLIVRQPVEQRGLKALLRLHETPGG